MTALLLGVFLLAGLMLRLAFCGIGRSSDEWVTFWLIRRQRGHRGLNVRVDNAVNPGTYAYPQLQHWLIARFPERLWGVLGRLLNAAYDVLTGALLVVVLTVWLGDSAPQLAGLSLAPAALLLFLSSPALLPSAARMRAIKARSLGLLLFCGWFLAVGVTLRGGPWALPAGLGAVVLFELVILASAFALQAVVFTAFGLSLFLLSPVPVLLVLAGLVVGVLLPRLGTREALWFFWSHKVWYVGNAHKGTTAAGRNRLRDMLGLPVLLVRQPRRALWLLFWQNSFFIAVYSSPLVVVLLVVWFRHGMPWGTELPLPVACLWGGLLGAVLAFVLTSLKPLAFLGQAERYFEYAAPITAVLAVLLLASWADTARAGQWYWLLLGLHLLGAFLNAVLSGISALGENLHMPEGLGEVGDWLLEQTDQPRVATMSPKLAYVLAQHFERAGRDDARFYYRLLVDGRGGMSTYAGEIGGPLREPGRDEASPSMELFTLLPDELQRRYGVDTLVIDRAYEASLRDFWADQADLLDRPAFENKRYLVLRLPAGADED